MQTPSNPPALDTDLCRLVERAFPREGHRRVVAEWLAAQYAETIADLSKIDAQHWATLPGVLAADLRAAVEHDRQLAPWREERAPIEARQTEARQKTEATTKIMWTPLVSADISHTLVDMVQIIDAEPDTQAMTDPVRVELSGAFVQALDKVSTFSALTPAPTDLLNEAIRLAPPEVLTPEGDVKVIVDTAHRMRIGMTLAWMRSGAKADVGPLGECFRVEGLAAFAGERGEVDPCDDAALVAGVNPTTGAVWSRVSAPLRSFARWLATFIVKLNTGARTSSQELARDLARDLTRASAFEPIGGEAEALAQRVPRYAARVTYYLNEVKRDPGLPERLRAANYPLRATLRPQGTNAPPASTETPVAPLPDVLPRNVTADDIDVLAMVLHRLYPTGPRSRLHAVVGTRLPDARPTCAQWRAMLTRAWRGNDLSPILWATTVDHPRDPGLLDFIARTGC